MMCVILTRIAHLSSSFTACARVALRALATETVGVVVGEAAATIVTWAVLTGIVLFNAIHLTGLRSKVDWHTLQLHLTNATCTQQASSR